MFAAKTKALVKNLGAQGDLIHNENVNEKIEMMTLVKVKQKKLWPVIRYTITDQTLLDLLEEPDVCPEYSEKVLTEDFKNLIGRSQKGCAAAGFKAPEAGFKLGSVKVSAAVDTVDAASSFTLKRKTLNIEKLRKCATDKKIKKKLVDMLKVKQTDKLTFVYQILYNTTPVTFFGKAGKDRCVSAVWEKFVDLGWSCVKNEEVSFTVPRESTFAYGLMEITTEDGTLGIPPRTRKVWQYRAGWWDITSDSCESVQEVKKDMKIKEALLQPLADLPASTRRNLLKTLSELVEDGDALDLLEETLSTGGCDRPPSPAVSAFMDLLKASNASTAQKDAVHLLVSAMDTLPDGVPVLLTTCGRDTLTVLSQLVDSLKEDAEAKLPESLPLPLQEEGELRWAAKLLSAASHQLTELSDNWDTPELPLEVLLEVLVLTVQGLSMMQPRSDS